MHILTSQNSPVFILPGATFTGMAAPSRGAKETAAWRASIAAGSPGLTHRVTREEIFYVLSGSGIVSTGGMDHPLVPGAMLIMPPEIDFALSNPHAEALELLAITPVGGQAQVGEEAAFTPPWAE
jgi:quercetin dioxygenase-like cupin family protein